MHLRIDPFQGAQPAYLGTKEQVFGGLDTFPAPAVDIVRMTSDEVTSMCPITGQPDFEVIDVTYAPRDLCIESKSWKMYLTSLRDTAAFVESLADEIAKKIMEEVKPMWVRVDVTQKARGGVSIVAVAMRGDGRGDILLGIPPRNYYLGH